MVADILTFSRMLFSLLLLVFSPLSPFGGILYLLCGVTDVLDGFAARRLHTESDKGAKLDSAADLIFAGVYSVRILPLLSVPLWIWIWAGTIAAAKIAGILIAGKKAHGLKIEHSFGNRLTGLLLFLWPLSVRILNVRYGAALAGASAAGTVIMELRRLKRLPAPPSEDKIQQPPRRRRKERRT